MTWTTAAGALIVGALVGLIVVVFGTQKGPMELRPSRHDRDKH